METSCHGDMTHWPLEKSMINLLTHLTLYDLFPFHVTLKNLFLCQGGGSAPAEEGGDLKRPFSAGTVVLISFIA